MKAAALAVGLGHPLDRNGRRPADLWSTTGMEETQQALRVAAHEADQAVRPLHVQLHPAASCACALAVCIPVKGYRVSWS